MLRLVPSPNQLCQSADRAPQYVGLSIDLMVVACQGDLSQASALGRHVAHGGQQNGVGLASVAQFPERRRHEHSDRVVVWPFGSRRSRVDQASLVRA